MVSVSALAGPLAQMLRLLGSGHSKLAFYRDTICQTKDLCHH